MGRMAWFARSCALFTLLSLAACSSSSSPAVAVGDDAGDAVTDAASDADALPADIRGMRYCELLLATVSSGMVHVDVWNTFGLNDCPDAQWSAIDPAAIAKAEGVTQVIVNGPRYWMLDAFVMSTFIDPTPKTLGGIPMRHAGSIDMPFDPAGESAPYVKRTIQRNTTFRFDAGKPVFELVDPDGKIYDMQSYSTQKTPQTEADLAGLGAKLKLPAGWNFRSRTLSSDLLVSAVGGLATVVQDDFGNTYQQSQQ